MHKRSDLDVLQSSRDQQFDELRLFVRRNCFRFVLQSISWSHLDDANTLRQVGHAVILTSPFEALRLPPDRTRIFLIIGGKSPRAENPGVVWELLRPSVANSAQ